ncbi:MAG TPA: F0F1 ATP synthase subunit gamma [Candidatus Competibacteraceae bacterium]|nr:F0F1 ATP synthase subunit gamma [Candidatus Competibacteraceae bacterium]
MAGAKEIRNKIKSIRNTQKITRAMEMVAASKMRKAQDRMLAARPYAEKIRNVVSHLAHAHTEYRHPFLLDREVKRVGYIIVSTDRGLCGGLNNNLFKAVVASMKGWRDQGVEIDLCIVGNKGVGFFKRLGGNLVAQATHLGDAPHAEDLIGVVKVMLDAYQEGRVDRVFLAYNRFINTMTQRPQVEQLIPVSAEVTEAAPKHRWDYIYEPDAQELLDMLLTRYIESLVYQGVVDNIACEMAARMIAMKSASDNAGNLINELQLVYNKARQAAITQELSEIVAGAAAV